jgi:excisionase family DNA binding protein
MTTTRPDPDSSTAATSEVDALLTVEEAGQWLGTGERFARRLVSERRIQFVKVGRHVRIPASAVRNFIEAATVNPTVRRRG